MRQSRKRKSAKISDAVFRGKKGDYTFEVYPFGAEIPETPAVFIFSRRKVHRTGRVSHAASCIGETDSLPDELKKHKRAKCVKTNESNVVCVLRDENGRNRLAVLSDITEARTFGCVRNVYEPTIMRRPDVLHIAAAKHADAKPARRRKIEEPQADEAPVKQTRRKRASKDEVTDKPKAGPRKKPKTRAKAQPARKANAKTIPRVKAETVRKAKTTQKVKAKAQPAREVRSTAKPARKAAATVNPIGKTSVNAGKPRSEKPRVVKPKATTPKAAKGKVNKLVRTTAAPAAASAERTSTTTRTVAAQRTKPTAKPAKPGNKNAKPAARSKNTAVRSAKPAAKPVKQAAAKPRKTKPATKAKRTTAAAKPRTRVSGGVDRDRGKHRLPEQKRPARGRATAGTAKRTGTRKKASA